MLPATTGHSAELGSSVPIYTPHAVSVSLPTWKDNVDYELGLERVHSKLSTGYPRFFIHLDIQKLAEICRAAHALSPQERCMLFPSEKAANLCRKFVADRALKQAIAEAGLEKRCRLVRFEASSSKPSSPVTTRPEPPLRIFVLFVPDEKIFGLARTFWQHTGLGISSRFAERALRLMGSFPVREAPRAPNSQILNDLPSPPNSPAVAPRRYNVKQSPKFPLPAPPIPTGLETDENTSTYVEERYGRNLPIQHVQGAKLALRRRIADILVETAPSDGSTSPPAANLKRSERGAGQLTESDIYLYPTGMSSIFYAHQLAMSLQVRLHPDQPIGKSICFGFPYTDTLKIVEKWGPGAHFFGHGESDDLQALAQLLEQNQAQGIPPIAALFCEFPSNPLLKSPDLVRLRQLADQYGFLVVIDETIGNFLNVEVLPYADILVSSLTKVFSGDSNVMGGSMIINPSSKHHSTLKGLLDGDQTNPTGMYEDTYFGEDAIFMERNSRDFRTRVAKINGNASGICEYLMSLRDSEENKIIKSIHYPRYTTRENYEMCRRKHPPGGYGGLFSIIFHDAKSCETFYDHLKSYKGPSLGTNFTLSSPYVLLAHFNELEWASQFGVDSNLIRVSVGLEDLACLLQWFQFAFQHANS
ncbi:hypothetical protein PGT21_024117 [Puccinia graminis f. sp. tritici]|uniref:cystathionine gamma-synthase n=1 Tax=Puccinia graminis f. sp. tritici TaxID=56615 RepID=A0A5B0RF24_PUCGR|nr:hypothetical protein PGT21_024117 [Puccinia graminis f. sp. tritici]KAA1124012.1 hypothetical protein PGTUg99_019064 [Puccinia graminis f. sp. tritici]